MTVVIVGIFAWIGLAMLNVLIRGKKWQRCTLLITLSFLAFAGQEYFAKYNECNNWKRNYLCPHAETREQRRAFIAKLRKNGYVVKEDPNAGPLW
jgi:hypothetical protein